MFSIFSYIMSRVTHSEPGLPMQIERERCHGQILREYNEVALIIIIIIIMT